MDPNWRLEPEKYRGTLWEYYEDRFIDVGGTKTRYWDEGAGAPVVLVHGFGGSVEEWAMNIPALARRHRVIALDMPGFGFSAKPDEDYTYEYFASFLDAFMEASGIGRAHLVGHSMGGAISLNLALRYPGRVRSLALIAPAFGRKFPFAMHLLTAPLLGEMLFRPPATKDAVAAGFRSLTYEEVRYADIQLERYFRIQREPGYARAGLAYLRNYMTPLGFTSRTAGLERFYREALPRLDAPVFLAWGPQDAIVHFDSSRELRGYLPRAEFWSPEPCGHGPHFEYPEEFNARALDFFARN
jgi:pimeloyl-ACP methyl ester carboxylesterase